MTKLSFYEELEQNIKSAYESAVSPEEAERLAAKFLLAQLEAGRELAALDLDSRMKKTGLKSLKAAVYLESCSKGENGKKPTEATLAALVDSDKLVCQEQVAYDTAEVERDKLDNYLNIFREAHIFFRGVSKGRFE